MILFISDVLDHGATVENFLAIDPGELECHNFTKIFELWRTFTGILRKLERIVTHVAVGGQRRGRDGFDTRPLYENTMKQARGKSCSVNVLTF